VRLLDLQQAKEIRGHGYMPDFFGVYDDMKVIEYLEFFAAAYRIKGRSDAASAIRCSTSSTSVQARRPGNEPVARHDAASRFGPRAAARTAVLLLDDRPVASIPAPASRCANSSGAAQHGQDDSRLQPHPAELADICNKIGIIERGQLIFNGDVESAIKQVRKHKVYFVAVANDLNQQIREMLEAHVDILSVRG